MCVCTVSCVEVHKDRLASTRTARGLGFCRMCVCTVSCGELHKDRLASTRTAMGLGFCKMCGYLEYRKGYVLTF